MRSLVPWVIKRPFCAKNKKTKTQKTKDKTEKKKKKATKTMKEVKVSNLLRPSLIKRILQNSFPGLFLRSHRLIRYSLGWLCAEFEGSLASMTSSTARTSYDNLQPALHYFKSLCLQIETFTSSNLMTVELFRVWRKHLKFVPKCSLGPHIGKIAHFTSLKERERLRNVKTQKFAECKARNTVFNCEICKFAATFLPSIYNNFQLLNATPRGFLIH